MLFRATADRLVFATDYEAAAFGAAPRSPVIPIGSNVPTHPGEPKRDTDTVLYFGQIRPDKGIEDFIALAALSTSAGEPTRFVVIGSAPPRWHGYRAALRAQSPANVHWMEDAPLPAVAQAMATAWAAFLPFPDGAGLRRGSLLAALSNGLPVVAPFGPSTTEALRAALLQADTPDAALAQLRALRTVPALARQRSAAGRALARRFSWTAIAEAHVALYRGVLEARAGPEQTLSMSHGRIGVG
jgi:glycosyltransferase involved in cell wall biosynthesis